MFFLGLKMSHVGKSNMSLEVLISKLHEVFEDDKINVDEVQHLMESFNARPIEWRKYSNFDKYRYTRNLIDKGNGKFNLILLCWGEGHGSGIHDHSNSHCWMKIMDGVLTENLYGWPKQEYSAEHMEKMEPVRILDYKRNQVAYINDSIGLHRIENNSHSDQAVSLHLYSPPFDMCQSFDERTGRKNTCKVTYWSEFGVRTPFGRSETPYEQTVEQN